METEQSFTIIIYKHKSSYRTYEEWKRVLQGAIGTVLSGSYRTYEEWKHTSLNRIK